MLGWPARLWLGDRLCLTGHAVDATRGTIRISLVNWIPSDSLEAGVNGIHVLENLKLDELAARRIYEFAFVMQPLKIQGGSGSTVAPVAIR